MTHRGTETIETQRLILRRFTADDAEAMFSNWASDSEVSKYLSWQAHSSPEETASLLAEWAAMYGSDSFYKWALVLKESGEPVGDITGFNISDEAASVEIGYCLGRDYWHMGLTSEALEAVIGFFFDRVGMERVEARHDPQNPRSGLVMKRCGMKYEGTRDSGKGEKCRYAITKTDRR